MVETVEMVEKVEKILEVDKAMDFLSPSSLLLSPFSFLLCYPPILSQRTV